ncbi:hypothetical protein ACWIBQ_13180 [Microbacterium keratanolyticum]
MLLRDVCTIHSGFSARSRPEIGDGGLLALQQGCVTASGQFEPAAASRVDSTTGTPGHRVQAGDVLLRSRGDVASAWAIDEALSEPALALLPLYILRPTSDVLDAGYLAWFVMQPGAQAHFARESVGSNIQMIRKPTIESLPIEKLPTLHQQQQLAALARLASQELALETSLTALRHKRRTLQLQATAATIGTTND